MENRRNLVRVLLSAAVIGAVAAGAQEAAFKLAPRVAAKGKANQPLVLRISYHDPSLAFALPIRQGVEAAAKEFKVDAKMVGPVGGGAEKQVSELENLLTSGVDGLAVSSASTDALVPLINKAIKAGIPVVAFNTDNPKANRLTFIGQDLKASGRGAGEQLVKAMGTKGKVLIFTVDAAGQWSKDREAGVRQALAKHPGITVAGVINTTNESQQTYAAIESAMTANPDVTGIVSLDCCSTPAAGQYLKRSGLSGKVKMVGFDLLDQQLQQLKDGTIHALVGQNPYQQGYQAVKSLVALIRDGKMPPKTIDTGVEIVDASNVGKHLKK